MHIIKKVVTIVLILTLVLSGFLNSVVVNALNDQDDTETIEESDVTDEITTEREADTSDTNGNVMNDADEPSVDEPSTNKVLVNEPIVKESRAVTNLQELVSALADRTYDEITIGGSGFDLSGTVLEVNRSVKIKAESGTVTLSQSVASTRHMKVTGGTIQLSFENVILDGGSVGGGINSSATDLTVKNAQLFNCRSSSGGAIYGSTIKIVGNTVIKGNIAEKGGGIYGTTIDISGNAKIGDNKASAHGGGITGNYISISGDAEISNNHANNDDNPNYYNLIGTKGGGIYVNFVNSPRAGRVDISGNAKIVNNTANGGGGIFADTGSIITISENALISGNEAIKPGAKSPSRDVLGAGGAIDGWVNNIIIINGGDISNNKAVIGGGIYVSDYDDSHAANPHKSTGSTLTINGGKVSHNIAESGGGVYGETGAIITVTGGEISGNEATQGGGIYGSANSTISISGNANISTNKAVKDGGGIYGTITNTGTTTREHQNMDGSTTIFFTGGQISQNTAGNNGGGIYNIGKNVSYPGNVSVSGGEINNNLAKNGGGIYNDTNSNITITGSVLMSANKATHIGGGIFSSETIKIEGGTITNNTVSRIKSSDNTELLGGGIYSIGTIEMTGGLITNNTVSYDTHHTLGGGIYAVNTINMSGGTICNNNADSGGGIYIQKNGELNVSAGLISDNASGTGGGGGIASGENCTLNITGGTITRNAAIDTIGIFSMGGGIHLGFEGTMNISGNTIISDNTGTTGGGIFCDTGSNLNIFDDVKITNNTATGRPYKWVPVGGGGIYCLANNKIMMYGGEISGNISNTDGGGIFGAPNEDQFYQYADSSITIMGGKIMNNEANNGGGIYCYSGNLVTINGGEISGNKAASNGGGIYNSLDGSKDGIVTISGDSIIRGNTAIKDGGGIWTYDLNRVKIGADVIFDNNSASRLTRILDTDKQLHKTNILTRTFTQSLTNTFPITSAYNNYDINYSSYLVTFKYNDNTTDDLIVVVAPNGTVNKPTDSIGGERTFKGWYTDVNCTIAWDFNTQITSDTILYAKWQEDKYGVTYVGNGNTSGTVPTDATRYEKGTSATVKDKGSLIKEGYTFSGWNTQANGTGKMYVLGDPLIISGNMVLYAQWVKNTEIPTPKREVFIKEPNKVKVRVGDYVEYRLSGIGNRMPDTATNFCIIDNPPVGLKFIKGSVPAFTNGQGLTYTILYATNLHGKEVLYKNVDATKAFNFHAPKLKEGEYITSIIVMFDKVPVDFGRGNKIVYTFEVEDIKPGTKLVNKGFITFYFLGQYFEYANEGNSEVSVYDPITGEIFDETAPQTGDIGSGNWPVMSGLSGLVLAVIVMKKRRGEIS